MGIFSRLFGEYLIFRIYSVEPCLPDSTGNPCFREIQQADTESPDVRQGYGGYHSIGFIAEEGGKTLAHCWFWYGERYLERNFWPLGANEAKLVRIETLPECRGRGVAPALIAYSTAEMAKRGFTRLYARIWHSYKPSLKAFRKAGWKQVAIVLTVPFRGKQRRFIFGRRPNG